MKLSQRVSAVGVSLTIAITAKAKAMRSEGIDIVSFGAGEPDFDTPQFIKDAAIAALSAGDTKYTPRCGAELLQAIADKLSRENNLQYATNEIMVTLGGKHALYDAFQALVDPDDKVLIPAPYWVSYPEMVRLAGGEPVVLETNSASGFKITPQQILEAADDAKILVINSPSNPTSIAYTPTELKAIADAVLQTDLIVFSDEIYEKLIYGDTEFVSFAALDQRLKDRTVIFNGVSKTFSMTGWRIGWLAGPQELIKAIGKIKSHETTNAVSFAQAGALAAYTSPQSATIVEEMRKEFQKRGAQMAERLNAIQGVSCLSPAGAFYCFPDVSAHYGRTIGGVDVKCSMTFAQAALDSAEVAIVPGCAFGEDKCVRLSFATSMEQIDKGIDRLEKLLA